MKITTFEQLRKFYGNLDLDVMDLKCNRVENYEDRKIAKVFIFEDGHSLSTIYVY